VSEAFRETRSLRDDDRIVRLPREGEGTGRSDTIQPMWAALLAASADRAEGEGDRRGPEIVACDLEGSGASWRDRLRAAIDQVPPGGTLGVSGNRAIPTVLLGARSQARRRRVTAPPPRRVEEALSDAGLRVVGRYRVWPSSKDPRIAWSGSSAAGWMQRSGVLGGGGERILGRAAARSRLVTPLVTFLAPGYAVAATRPTVQTRWTD
jgi:hypothetical protein